MRHTILQGNFIYPIVTPSTFRLGAIEKEIIRSDGDWRNFLPLDEEQRRRGIESSSCYIQAQQHAIATILEEEYNIKDSNFSERFNFILSNGTQNGGNPIEGADSIRKDGLVSDELFPFSEIIQSWSEFNSWKGGDEVSLRAIGKKFIEEWIINYEVVFLKYDSIEEKYRALRKALKYSPVPISVYGWIEENGVYVKTSEIADNHLTLCIYLDDDNCPWVLDTYAPFIKKLQPFYPSDFAMSLSVSKKWKPPVINPEINVQNPKLSFWQRVVQWIKRQKTIFTNLKQ